VLHRFITCGIDAARGRLVTDDCQANKRGQSRARGAEDALLFGPTGVGRTHLAIAPGRAAVGAGCRSFRSTALQPGAGAQWEALSRRLARRYRPPSQTLFQRRRYVARWAVTTSARKRARRGFILEASSAERDKGTSAVPSARRSRRRSSSNARALLDIGRYRAHASPATWQP
jgi:hypothetical protein